jgi:hypothetical protein
MTAKNMNMSEQTQSNVMADNAILTPPPSTQPTTANEAPVDARLQRWIDFCEQTANEVRTPDQHNTPPPFTDNYDESRKANTETKWRTKLKKLEGEQKAILLAEAQKKMEEARRNFKSQPQVPYDYNSGPPSTIEDIFRAEKAREELKALEREQKEALLKQVMEKRAKEAGDEWPRIQGMSQDPRFDHIPKRWPGYRGLIANYFHDHPLIPPQKSNEHPTAS